MLIRISQKDVSQIRRLGTRLNDGIIPVDEVKQLVSGLQQKIDAPAASGAVPKQKGIKDRRKDHYRNKLQKLTA